MGTRALEALDIDVLKRIPKPNREEVLVALKKERSQLSRKIVVLDDDPTGIQTVHDVSVYTRWDLETVLAGFREEGSLFFILTNSRAFTAGQTQRAHEEIAQNIALASQQTNKDFLVISRGDSTLRGHYPLETETLRRVLEAQTGKRYQGEVIVPFFQEGGRFTLENVHYVREGDRLIPAGQTEFAQDRTFGYRASHLGEWCEEKTGGRYPAEAVIGLPLAQLRALAWDQLAERMREAKDFAKIIVNAADTVDVESFCVALCRAIQGGGEYLFRSAAALPKALGGIPDKPLLAPEELVQPGETHGGVVVVGSHVSKTTRQLAALRQSAFPMDFIEFDQHLALVEGGLEKESARVAREVDERITAGRTAIVYTRRDRLDLDHEDSERQLLISVRISAAVTDVVAQLTARPRFIVAKGGITSSDVGTRALRVRRATVMGQVAPGVPAWKTGLESKFPGMPYVIFPGNVGEETTLREVVEKLQGAQG